MISVSNIPQVILDMLLLVMRHGKAEPKKPGLRDEERRLTDEGRSDVEYVAKILPNKPSRILCSPMVRAKETAEIVAKVHGVKYEVVRELLPENVSVDSLGKLVTEENTLLIGHAPSIEDFISELIGGGRVKMKAGAVAGLDVEEFKRGGAKLVYLITPQIARKLVES